MQILAGPYLVGVYLHGSLALGGFNPSRSDPGLLAVAQDERGDPGGRGDLGAAFWQSLAVWLLERSGHPHALEVHVLRMACAGLRVISPKTT